MSVRQLLSLVELFRVTPAKSTLLGIGPLALAIGQLGNSYVNGVAPLISISFAAVMVAFAVVATRHHAAEHRLRQLQQGMGSDASLEAEISQQR